ncbi:MAG: penicillin-binding protein 2 [Myxococcota bacterium]
MSGDQRDPSPALGRAYAMGVVVVLAFTVVLARLYGLQVRQGPEFRERSRNNFFQFERLEHDRGEIVDRRGRVLVTNRPSTNVYVTPAFFPRTSRLLRRLGRPLGLSRSDAEDTARALERAAEEEGPPILLADGLTRATAEALRAMQERLELPLDALPIIKTERGFAAYVDASVFPSAPRALLRLSELVGLDRTARRKLALKVRRTRGLDRYQDILVRRDLPPEVEGPLTLEVELGELPGVTVRRASARDYRYGTLAAHTIGYVNEVSLDDLDRRKGQGYRVGDVIGRRGIERTFEEELRGTDGRETVVVDSKGRTQSTALADVLQRQVGIREAPRPGHRVVLTLDLNLQRAAEAAFDGLAGSVVLLEVETGSLLALTSTPSFDPSKLAGYFDPAEKARLDSMGTLRPWRFRAIQDHFAPGSTFKVVTALAALQGRHTHAHERVFCPGHFKLGGTKWRCWRDEGHGQVDLPVSLAWSCDTYYYTLGARMGIDPIVDLAAELGFGRPTGIALGPESSGVLPTREWFRKHRRTYTTGQAVNASIGQGAVSVTPLQLAVAFAAIANGGKVLVPRIASRIETYDGQLVDRIQPKVARTLNVDPEHLAVVQDGLYRVVNHPTGTAFRKRLRNLEVSGKTGTAQVRKMGDRRKSRTASWKFKDHAWFAAYAPSENPEVVVVVFNEHGGGGSSTAAPIAMRVLDAWRTQREWTASLGAKP